MAFEGLIDRIEEGADVRAALRPHRGSEGLCEAYFGRLLAVWAADPARAARLAGHWRAFLELGDDPALAYRAKGAADRVAGRWLASARAFVRAGELARWETERLSYAVGAVDCFGKAGRVDEARALGAHLADALDALGESALAARARLNAANALLAAERGPEARRLYLRAIPHLTVTEEAMARLGLSTTHLYGGDPAVAAHEAAAARTLAVEAGGDYLAVLCEMNLAHVALLAGRADEAFASLPPLRARLAGSPSDLARLEESIGDACLRLNLLDEAADAYGAALALRDALPALDRAHVRLGLGEALAASDPEAADGHLRRAASAYRALGNPPWRAAANAARVELRPRARNAVAVADSALRDAKGSPYHECLALLARAEAGLARGEDVRPVLRRAKSRLRRFGYRRFAWRVHALRARGSADPLPHYRRMLAEILRDRLATTSVAARAGFLRDKSAALGAYLECLLADPSPRRVREAREAIRRTRAATLLDEILRAPSLRLDDARARRLEALRAQVAGDVAEDRTPDSRRIALPAHPARREWVEASHVLGALDGVAPESVSEDGVLFAQTGERLWAIVGARAVPLRIDAPELEDALRWLRFEMRVPMADRNAPAARASALLAKLSDALVSPWAASGDRALRLCPDGLLWGVPWDALLERPEAATLVLHPSLSQAGGTGSLRRVAIWIDTPDDLPNAAAEERMLCERFPHAVVLRSRAEILASLDAPWDLVHVVGHARHNPGNPMFSALSFADGPLYAAEIARSGLRTRLACLSACETGNLSLDNREEPDGLVRAFLARGAEAVLASLWPLDDEAASRFFHAMYTALKPGVELAEAVAQARWAVREWRDHPYFWASLSLFGGYRT